MIRDPAEVLNLFARRFKPKDRSRSGVEDKTVDIVLYFKPTVKICGWGYTWSEGSRDHPRYFYGKLPMHRVCGEMLALDGVYAVGIYDPYTGLKGPHDVTRLVKMLKDLWLNGERITSLETIRLASYLVSQIFAIYDELKEVNVITYVPCYAGGQGRGNMRKAIETGEYICVVEAMAREVAGILGKPVVDLFEKHFHIDLGSKNCGERLELAKAMYTVKEDKLQEVVGKTVAIIDDVVTSGATLHTLATKLRKHLNSEHKIYGVALARTILGISTLEFMRRLVNHIHLNKQ